jgi:dephospho-CoA kinase
MIRIGILGDIGSGKSYVAKNFGYPVFNADYEVVKLYQQNRDIFKKLRAKLPKYIHSFPIEKKEISNAILANKRNLNKIIKIVHFEIRKKMNSFLKKNKNKKIIILDIPLLLENKIYKKRDILVFVQSRQSDIIKRLKRRINYNQILLERFKSIQYSTNYKKRKSDFIIKNDFTKKSVNDGIKNILKELI